MRTLVRKFAALNTTLHPSSRFQMTTVGYGDINPTNTYEMVAAMIMEFVGVLFFAFVVGNILNLLEKQSKMSRRSNMYREKMGAVNQWMDSRDLPEGTRIKIQVGW